MPGAEVDSVGRRELHLLVVSLEFERREGEVVEPHGALRNERAAVELVGKAEVKHQDSEDYEAGVRHWGHLARSLPRTLRARLLCRLRATGGEAFLIAPKDDAEQDEPVHITADVSDTTGATEMLGT